MISFDSVCFVKWLVRWRLVRWAVRGLPCPEGQRSVAPRLQPPARGPELSPRPAWPISASRAWGWETPHAGLAPLSFWWRRRPRLATGFALARAGFLAVRRASDVASLASASAKVLLASSKSALAFLACFLARLAMSLTSLRLRLAIRACSFAAFHCVSAVATRRRAVSMKRPVFANQLWVWMSS